MSVKKFANILKENHKEKKTGILNLVFSEGKRSIFLKEGEIVYVKSEYPEEKLGNILLKQNLITEKELEKALKESKKEDIVLGEYLVNKQKLTSEQLRESLKQLFLLIIEACFLEEMKELNFSEEDISIEKNLFLDVNTGNLVLETFRKINHTDFKEFYEEHKDKKPVLNQKSEFVYSNLHLNPIEGFVLSRIDGKLTLEEIKKIAFTDEETFYKTIFALDFLGLLDFGEEEKEETNRTNLSEDKTQTKKAAEVKMEEQLENSDEFKNHIEQLYLELPTLNYYDLLLVDYDFTKEDLKLQYHRLIKKYHPDSHPELKEIHHKLQAIVSKITEAYNTLKDPYEKKLYDKKMHINIQKNTQKTAKNNLEQNNADKSEPQEDKEELKKTIENYIKAGMFYDAITLLENGCKKYKDDIYFFKTLGNIYFRTPTKLKLAIKYLEKAHSMDRKDAQVLNNLAGAYKKVGFYREAYTYYKKLLAIDPEHKEANEFISEVENKNSILDKIKKLFK